MNGSIKGVLTPSYLLHLSSGIILMSLLTVHAIYAVYL